MPAFHSPYVSLRPQWKILVHEQPQAMASNYKKNKIAALHVDTCRFETPELGTTPNNNSRTQNHHLRYAVHAYVRPTRGGTTQYTRILYKKKTHQKRETARESTTQDD